MANVNDGLISFARYPQTGRNYYYIAVDLLHSSRYGYLDIAPQTQKLAEAFFHCANTEPISSIPVWV